MNQGFVHGVAFEASKNPNKPNETEVATPEEIGLPSKKLSTDPNIAFPILVKIYLILLIRSPVNYLLFKTYCVLASVFINKYLSGLDVTPKTIFYKLYFFANPLSSFVNSLGLKYS
jgi:hypothetical protein